MQLLTLALATIAAASTAINGAAIPIRSNSRTRDSDGLYHIINVFLGTAMTMPSDPNNGSQIVLSPYTGALNQQWYVHTYVNGISTIENAATTGFGFASTVQTTTGQAPGYATLQTNQIPTYFTITEAMVNSTTIRTPDGSVLDFYHYDALDYPAIPVILDAPGQVGEEWYFESVY